VGREDLQVLRGRLVLLRLGAREGRQVEARLLGMFHPFQSAGV
jgi:hypothetical protein